jgi:predicted RNase H-like nuclease (RuvC/YqgF family)
MYEAEQVVSLIEGLNSLSTFHRWRKLVEEMCDITFSKQVRQVGITSYTKVYQFSKSDVEKFRQVAVLRNRGQPIKKAILSVFKEEKKKETVDEQNKQLFDKLINAIQTLDEDRQKLMKATSLLERQLFLLVQRTNKLEQRIEAVETGKMDKPFQRKKS